MCDNLRDGLHLGIDFETYLHWPFYSQSVLKEGRHSPAHLRAAWEGERVKVPTDDMILGTALHTVFLEPDLAAAKIVVWDAIGAGGRSLARWGKQWNDFRAENFGKIILTEGQRQKVQGMVASLRHHPEVKKWRGRMEAVEVSAIGLVHGLRMKGRCDALTTDPLIDLKKVANADPRRIVNAVSDYGYDIQGYVYTQLFHRERWLLLCVEDEPPYDVTPYELSPAYLRVGKDKTLRLIERVLECEATGVWPGRSDVPVLLDPPEWEMKE